MMAAASPVRPQVALRPMLAKDEPDLAAIFRSSIEELTEADYSPAQQAAWINAADDEAAFGARLQALLTLVASVAGAPVGFASLKGTDHIEMLYVHPAAVGQGVASALCEALERLSQARGGTSLSVEASDTAQGFFAKRGYEARQRGTVALGDEWLGRTSMRKTFGPKPQVAANG